MSYCQGCTDRDAQLEELRGMYARHVSERPLTDRTALLCAASIVRATMQSQIRCDPVDERRAILAEIESRLAELRLP